MNRVYGANDSAKLFEDSGLSRYPSILSNYRHFYEVECDIMTIFDRIYDTINGLSRGEAFYLWEDLRSKLIEYRDIFLEPGSEIFCSMIYNTICSKIMKIDELFPGYYDVLDLVDEEDPYEAMSYIFENPGYY